MNIQSMLFKIILLVLFANTITLDGIGLVTAEAKTIEYFYDTFDDGVIDLNLWEISGSVNERDGKIFLGTYARLKAKKQNLIGMSFSALGHQNITPGQHVGIDLITETPAGEIVTVGESREYRSAPPTIYSYVYCQWYEGGYPNNLHHFNLKSAQWGTTYVFGLEYTPQGSILVKVNNQVLYTFASIPGMLQRIPKEVPNFGS